MPRQTRRTLNAKQATIAQIVAQNPGITIANANRALYGHFDYKLSYKPASVAVKAARAASEEVRNQIKNALGLGEQLVG